MVANETGIGGVGVDTVAIIILTIVGWVVASLFTIYGINYTARKPRRNEHLKELKEKVVRTIRDRLRRAREELPYNLQDFFQLRAIVENAGTREQYLGLHANFTQFEDAGQRLLWRDLENHFPDAARALSELEEEAQRTLGDLRERELRILEAGRHFLDEQGWTDNELRESFYRVLLYKAVGVEEIPDDYLRTVNGNPTASEILPRLLAQDLVTDRARGILEAYEDVRTRIGEVEETYASILASHRTLSGDCDYVN